MKAGSVKAPPRFAAVESNEDESKKDALVKKISEPLAVDDQDPDVLGERLRKASNQQLLRLAKVVETVQQKYGGRTQLIQALGTKFGKAKDKDYLAKLGSFSLPRLLDLVRSA